MVRFSLAIAFFLLTLIVGMRLSDPARTILVCVGMAVYFWALSRALGGSQSLRWPVVPEDFAPESDSLRSDGAVPIPLGESDPGPPRGRRRLVSLLPFAPGTSLLLLIIVLSFPAVPPRGGAVWHSGRLPNCLRHNYCYGLENTAPAVATAWAGGRCHRQPRPSATERGTASGTSSRPVGCLEVRCGSASPLPRCHGSRRESRRQPLDSSRGRAAATGVQDVSVVACAG